MVFAIQTQAAMFCLNLQQNIQHKLYATIIVKAIATSPCKVHNTSKYSFIVI